MNSQSQPSHPVFSEGITGACFNLEFSTGGWSADTGENQEGCKEKISTLSQLVERMQAALKLWMEWNRAYQELSGLMYSHRYDIGRLESLADELDRLRHRAASMTAQLLSRQQQDSAAANSRLPQTLRDDVPE